MKVKIVYTQDKWGYSVETMYFDGKEKKVVHDLSETPEDAVIGRDLVACHDLYLYMEKGYQLALAGETLELEYIDGEDDADSGTTQT